MLVCVYPNEISSPSTLSHRHTLMQVHSVTVDSSPQVRRTPSRPLPTGRVRCLPLSHAHHPTPTGPRTPLPHPYTCVCVIHVVTNFLLFTLTTQARKIPSSFLVTRWTSQASCLTTPIFGQHLYLVHHPRTRPHLQGRLLQAMFTCTPAGSHAFWLTHLHPIFLKHADILPTTSLTLTILRQQKQSNMVTLPSYTTPCKTS